MLTNNTLMEPDFEMLYLRITNKETKEVIFDGVVDTYDVSGTAWEIVECDGNIDPGKPGIPYDYESRPATDEELQKYYDDCQESATIEHWAGIKRKGGEVPADMEEKIKDFNERVDEMIKQQQKEECEYIDYCMLLNAY